MWNRGRRVLGEITNFSEMSQRAIPYALALAHYYESEAYFVHAIPARARADPAGTVTPSAGLA